MCKNANVKWKIIQMQELSPQTDTNERKCEENQQNNEKVNALKPLN